MKIKSRLLAVDPSLTCSGWALFDVYSGQLIGVGKVRCGIGAHAPWADRMGELQGRIARIFEDLVLGNGDLLVCEAPTTMRDPRAALLVEQVRAMFETLARSRSVEVPGRLNPRTIQYEIIGLRGRQLVRVQVKQAAIETVKTLYGGRLKELALFEEGASLARHQDIVDALLVGSAALARVCRARDTGQPVTAMFEESKKRSLSAIRRAWLARAQNACVAVVSAVCLSLIGTAQAERSAVVSPALTTDPRGPAELTVCTQNMNNYGSFADVKSRRPAITPEELAEKTRALVRRFAAAKCDVVALQEILGKNEEVASAALKEIISGLREYTGRVFEARVGASNDKLLHNGFLVAKDRASVENQVSYSRVELPKLMPQQKPRVFPRGPLEIQLTVRGLGDAPSKTVTLVTFHSKSRAGAAGDPAELEWETYRMEMAEGLRRIVENRHAQSFASGRTILVLLGDRNSNFDTASARILEGTLTIKEFQDSGMCRLSKKGAPLCKAGSFRPQRLFGLITADPQSRATSGTYQYKGEYYWLDDILLPAESLRYALRDPYREGDYATAIYFRPPEASDHALVAATLNW